MNKEKRSDNIEKRKKELEEMHEAGLADSEATGPTGLEKASPEQVTAATAEGGAVHPATNALKGTVQLLHEPGDNPAVRSPFANNEGQVNYPQMIAQTLVGLTQPEVSKSVTTILLACAAAIQVYDKRTAKFAVKVGKLADELGFVERDRPSKKVKKDKDKKRKKKDRKNKKNR